MDVILSDRICKHYSVIRRREKENLKGRYYQSLDDQLTLRMLLNNIVILLIFVFVRKF
jgi:hypothetical protein